MSIPKCHTQASHKTLDGLTLGIAWHQEDKEGVNTSVAPLKEATGSILDDSYTG